MLLYYLWFSAESLEEVDIYIGNTPSQGNFSTNGYTLCGRQETQVPLKEKAIIKCPGPISGRYVALQSYKNTPAFLTFCEITVHRARGMF